MIIVFIVWVWYISLGSFDWPEIFKHTAPSFPVLHVEQIVYEVHFSYISPVARSPNLSKAGVSSSGIWKDS